MREDRLLQRMEEEISRIPVIDLHTHLKLDNPNAKNLAEILFYHFVGWELISAGGDVRDELPRFGHDPLNPVDGKTAEKAFSKYIPYFKYLKSTSTYYSLTRIFKDLYQFDLENINSSNWKTLYDKVLKTGSDNNWTKDVLLKKAKIEASVTGVWRYRKRKPKSEWTDAELILPNLEMGSSDMMDILSEKKEDILSGQSIENAIENFFEKYCSPGISSFTTSFQPTFSFSGLNRGKAEDLVRSYLSGKTLSEEESTRIFYFILKKILEIANDKGLPCIVAIGTEGLIPETAQSAKLLPTGIQITHNFFPEMAKVFYHYPGIKFLVMLSSFSLSQDLCIIAKQFPNVYPLGFQWHNFYPAFVEQIIEQRLDILPYNRPIGFFSDAYCIEWSYGKLTLVKRALTKVLARRVKEGIYSEELALKIARRWLYENPREIYFGKE